MTSGGEISGVSIELIVALVVISGGTAAAYFKNQNDIQTKISMVKETALKEIAVAREKALDSQVKIDLLWKSFEDTLPQVLKRPTHLRMDELLDKFSERTITYEEMGELKKLLEEEQPAELAAKTDRAWHNALMINMIDFRMQNMEQKQEEEKIERKREERRKGFWGRGFFS